MIYTTLEAIRKHNPCGDGWAKLLKHLNKTQADDKPLSLLTILDSNGLNDALWCFRTLRPEHAAWARLTICDLVQPAMKLTTDPRPQAALNVSRKFARGETTQEELNDAEDNAWIAAGSTGKVGAAAEAAFWAAGSAESARNAAIVARDAIEDANGVEQETILRVALKQEE